ncbi:hypothetical protein EVAR_55008_1 [Eumeta japonica]|uniref:Uncharacterized protein n=1 Tax=Eumeta variegata TaxID=151549 RepID=A0A4C1YEG3_EUMVA|nr:hypothetical protein EVAR_55008_1 [Eumeta japonica]
MVRLYEARTDEDECSEIGRIRKQLFVRKYIDLEKAYDRVKRNDLWRTLPIHGVSNGLIQALQSLYRGCSACVITKGEYTDWLDKRKVVRQECVALPWLFNLSMDSTVSV